MCNTQMILTVLAATGSAPRLQSKFIKNFLKILLKNAHVKIHQLAQPRGCNIFDASEPPDRPHGGRAASVARSSSETPCKTGNSGTALRSKAVACWRSHCANFGYGAGVVRLATLRRSHTGEGPSGVRLVLDVRHHRRSRGRLLPPA